MKTLIGVLLATTLVAFGIASPAMSAPQEPSALPASHVSARVQEADHPQVTTGPDGTTTAVWERDNGAYDIIQAATRPPGSSFGAPVDLSAPGLDGNVPQITTTPDGTATAVWERSDASNFFIQAATRPPGGSFGAPVKLSAPGRRAFSPQISTAPDGTATAVWYRGSFVIQAATRPPGGSFGAPVDLSAPGGEAVVPQITTAPDGTATVVWVGSGIQAATRPPGGSFGAPVDLSAPGRNAYSPQVTTAPDGTATVVWTRFNGSNDIVQAATRPPGGTFGAPVDLSAPGQSALGPQITTAPDGTATAIWQRGGIIQAATRPPGGSFEAPVDLSAPDETAYYPQITTAPDGTATAVWPGSDFSDRIIRAATRPPGGSFGAPVDLSADGGNALRPQIAAAPDGTATAVWERDTISDRIIQAATRPPGGSFGAPVDLSLPTAKKPRFKLRIRPIIERKVKRGKKTTFKVKVKNTGDATARKLKLCAKGPKKLVKVPKKCRKPGKLAPGKSKTVKFKVKVKNRAKKGRQAKITFTAYAKGAEKKSGKATVKIR